MGEAKPEKQYVAMGEAPYASQSVTHNGLELTPVREGLAYILTPTNTATSLDPKKKQNQNGDDLKVQSVFYNPIQQFNRDLSVLAIRAYSEDLFAVREQKTRLRLARTDNKKRVKKHGALPKERGAVGPDAAMGEAHVQNPEANGAKRKAEEPPSQVVDDLRPQKSPRVADGGEDDGVRLDSDEQESPDLPTEQINGIAKNVDTLSTAQRNSSRKYEFRVLDALSATGLRALRYAQEIPNITSVTANDMSPDATQSIDMNVRHNKLEDTIKVTTGNAISHMYNFVGQDSNNPRHKKPNNEASFNSGKYDVIDLDPYGTAVPFLDAAIQALNDGGLLCVTCTDAGVWASCGYPEKTFALYGGSPIKGFHSHEGGLRLIINAISTSAARYGIAVEPLLSLSIDFYARIFVRVRKSPADVKFLAGKTMLVYCCDSGCGAWKTQPLGRNDDHKTKTGSTGTKHGLAQGPSCTPYCDHCGFKMHVSGPMYAGPIHNPQFIATILGYLPQLDKETYKTIDRIEGMLSTAMEESELEGNIDHSVKFDNPSKTERPVPLVNPALLDRHPFFFLPSALAGILHCQAPPEAAIKGAFRHAGYKVARSHTKPGSIRTNAPWTFVWEIMREWIRQKSPLKEGASKPGTAGFRIMQRIQRPAEAGTSERTEVAASMSTDGEHTGEHQVPSASTHSKEVVFDEKLGRDSEKKKRLVRYQTNPRANWGPMNRAKG